MSAAPDDLLKSGYDPRLMRRVVALVSPHKALFVTSLLLYVPLNLGALIQPYLMGLMVDTISHAGTPDVAAVQRLGLAYLVALLMQTGGQFVQSSLTQWLGARVTRDLRESVFAKLQRLDASFFDQTPAGKVMTRVTSDVEALAEVFSSGSATLVGDLLFLVATGVILLWVSPRLTLGSFAVLPVLAVGLYYFRRSAREAFRAVRTHIGRINGFLQEHISGMTVVQLFGQEARTAATFDEMNVAFKEANVRAIRLDAGIYAFVEAVSTAAVAILLTMASVQIASNAVSLGLAVAFVEYLQRFFLPVRDLSSKYTVVQSALAGAERIFSILDENEAIQNPPGARSIQGLGEGIAFEDVQFSYPGGNRAVAGVSFRVKQGDKVALVGRTGSGKSTLTRLLLRHYDVQSGRITVAGQDVRNLEVSSLRRTIISVPQDVYLFNGTLADNLRFGAPGVSDAQMMDALTAVQAHHLVARLPGGLQAHIKERGNNLSVGERQLLAFARALLADPPCIILDEATASVDPETERLLQAATEKLLENRTALIVAHRLSTLARSDNILVLQQGALIEHGTHQQLLALNGYYARLHALQTGQG